MRFSKLSILSVLLLLERSYAFGFGPEVAVNQRRQARESSESSDPSPSPRITTPPRTSPPAENSASASPPSRTSGRNLQSSLPTTRAKTYVDPRNPPGGVVIQTPITTSGSQYYKIGQTITIGWNYTSLIISPSAVNVEAFCSENSQTYTIAQNLSIAKPSVIWDTGSYTPKNDQPPLAMGIYTLLIYDEKSAVTAIPAAGNLAPFNGFKFGMYTPKPYTPLADFDCPTCEKSQGTILDTITIRVLVLLSTLFSLSFGLFFTLLP